MNQAKDPTPEEASPSEAKDEKRKNPRLPLEAVIHYQVEGSEFVNLSSNISSQGIFIKNFAPPPVGTEIKIKVELPASMGTAALQLLGQVVRVADGVGSEERGMGIEFTSVLADSPDAIRFFVGEIYEMDLLDRLEKQNDEEGYHYTPGPADVLRIQSKNRPVAERPETDGRRWLFGLLFLFVGILVGGGLVLLILLGIT